MQSSKDIKKRFSEIVDKVSESPDFPSLLQNRVCELLKSEDNISADILDYFIKELKERKLDNISSISALIFAFVNARLSNDKEKLYELLSQKELIEQKIKDQKKDIKRKILNTLNAIEEDVANEDEDLKELLKYSLSNVKLQSLELLGILKETTIEAILGAVEKGGDIEGNIEEIVKNIVYETINQGELTKARVAYIVKTVLEAAIEIADEDQAFAKEILYGTVYGSKRGISRAISNVKNELRLIPNEVQKEMADKLEKIKKEIERIDEDFINIVRESSLRSRGVSKNILNEIILKFDNIIEKLKKKSLETTEAIAEKISEIKNESLENELTSKAVLEAKELSKEAKKVGKYLLDITKGIVNGAIRGAKEAMKKE